MARMRLQGPIHFTLTSVWTSLQVLDEPQLKTPLFLIEKHNFLEKGLFI